MLQEAEFDDDPYAYQDDYGDGLADQDQRPQRRGLMFTVAVVLALAVIGTGGAFAYRAFFGTERSGDPPIIRADTGPNKMIPPQSGDSSGKLIQDRMTGGTERLVSREEQPVDPRDGRSGPRVIFPSPSQGANSSANAAPLNRPVPNSGGTSDDGNVGGAPAGASNSGSANSGNGLLSGDEPRKIRTVSVKGDQTDAAANPTPKPPVTRSIATASSAPLRTPTPVAANANASTNAPLSISPQAADTPPPRSRVASTNPAPQPIVAAAATSDGGGYVVQVSSQHSEADAQKSFKALQGKYPDLLGSREAMIKQADVGGKTVYRAMVGPFASSGEANQFCSGLKTAGGQCFVPRN
jgi:cell division septation protein DedD